jgi:hemerythrin-like metal-binding protein
MHLTSEEKFEAFSWDNKYNTDVDIVDEQHHKLVNLINQLGAISARQASTDELGAILTELANYTIYHFATEEKMMKEFGIEMMHQIAHMRAHEHFSAQVKVAAKLLLGSVDISHQLVSPLLKYLTNWLVQHILGLDKRMAQEIRALEAGATHEQAVRQANQVMSQSANVLIDALNEMFGKLGDKTLEVMQKNQELEAEHEALRVLNEELEARVAQRTADTERLMGELLTNNVTLLKMNEELESAQSQLLQSEKMASLGQLAAGVAHEINNPVGFVNSNLGTLGKYIESMFRIIEAYEVVEASGEDIRFAQVINLKNEIDFPYLREDIPNLLMESQDGLLRVKRIVQDLKDFSHVDESNWQYANIEQGLDSTLNVVSNELKYKAQVIKEYAGLPEVECLPSQLNQVFMNMLINAAQAIENKGTITVRTGVLDDEVWVEVEDTGKGISPEILSRIFDPFFTTKPVGKGTGLGLSLSYGIVQKHHGRIEVKSEMGKGTVFRVWLPKRHTIAP